MFSMRGAVAITDYNWASNLRGLSSLDECNFWQPSGWKPIKLPEMMPWIFKTRKAHGNSIIGFGLFLKCIPLSVRDAWQWFTHANGASDLPEFRRLLSANRHAPVSLDHTIGCVMLVSPVFFPEDEWFQGPTDWAPNIVNHKYYDLTSGEGKRVWDACRARADAVFAATAVRHNLEVLGQLLQRDRFGSLQLLRPRLGQGTFRAAVLGAYEGTCAVSKDHTWPALEAAHIKPYGDGGEHDTTNGLLLRADIHRLYDRHLVTVTDEFKFEVSPRLKRDFDNGLVYYKMQGQPIRRPKKRLDWPDPEKLRWHAEQLVL